MLLILIGALTISILIGVLVLIFGEVGAILPVVTGRRIQIAIVVTVLMVVMLMAIAAVSTVWILTIVMITTSVRLLITLELATVITCRRALTCSTLPSIEIRGAWGIGAGMQMRITTVVLITATILILLLVSMQTGGISVGTVIILCGTTTVIGAK